MSYTFGNQLDLLSTLLTDANTDSQSQWPIAVRKVAINFGEKEFANDTKALLENASGTVADMEIAVPTGWLETFAFYVTVQSTKYLITADREVSAKNLERWNDYAGDTPYYYFWGFSDTKKIKFLGSSSSINGSAYDFYYFKKPTVDLDLTTDISILPEEYRQASVYKAAATLLLQIGQYTRAGALQAQYDRIAGKARDEVRKQYKDTENASPDLNLGSLDEVDRQGIDSGY